MARFGKDTSDADPSRHVAEVHWDGSVDVSDLPAYFKDAPSVKRHLAFLDRHKERVRKQKVRRRRIAVLRGTGLSKVGRP